MKSTRTKSIDPVVAVKNSPSKKNLWIILGLVVVVLIGLIAAAYFILPTAFIGSSLAQFKNYTSFRVQYLPPTPNVVKVEASIHTNWTDLSKFTFEVPAINQEKDNNLNLNLLANKNDLYFQLAYSKIKTIEAELAKGYPPILELQTYQRALPVIEGNSYLHFDIPASTSSADKNKKDTSIKVTTKDQRQFAKATKSIYFLRSFNPFYQFEGQRYTRIIFGVNKNKLLEAIEMVKDSDANIKVSQINAFKKMVEATPGWNNDLMEFLIDGQHRLYKVTLRIPQVPDKVLSENLADSLSDEKSFKSMIDQANKYVKNKVDANSNQPKLMELGSIVFDQFDSAQKFAQPSSIVEAQSIIEVAEKELKPLLASLLTGQPLSLPTPTRSLAPPTTNKAPRPANCMIYQITGGPLASKKCYVPEDAQALGKLVEQRNNVVANNQVAFETAQTKCSQGDQDACKQSETIYYSATAQITSLEQQIKTITKRGW